MFYLLLIYTEIDGWYVYEPIPFSSQRAVDARIAEYWAENPEDRGLVKFLSSVIYLPQYLLF